MEKYDVAIIGAGPAGSTLAYSTAKKGIRTCIIDKQQFPRKKTCAGGLPPKVLEFIPFDITPTIKNEIFSVMLTHKIKKGFSRTHPRPLLYTVNREEFDHFLLQKAVTEKATFIEGEAVNAISPTGNGYNITTRNRGIKATIIAGADGINSITAEFLRLDPSNSRHLAIQVEIPFEKMASHADAAHTIALDWGHINDGYAWLFPNGGYFTMGVMGHPKSVKALKSYLRQWTEHFGLNIEDFQLHAQSIPHRTRKSLIAADRALLVGDAAGLADFWTGEGIYHAIKSANIAATHIAKYLAGDHEALQHYETEVNETILSDLIASYTFSRVFNYSHLAAFHAIRKYPYMWDLFCRIIRGDRSFVEIKQRLKPAILAKKLLSTNSPARPFQ